MPSRPALNDPTRHGSPASTIAADTSPHAGPADSPLRHPRSWPWRMLPPAVLGLAGLWLLIQWLCGFHHIDAVWKPTQDGRVELVATHEPQLHEQLDNVLHSVAGASGERIFVDASALQRSSRWLTDDLERSMRTNLHERIDDALASGAVLLQFADGRNVSLEVGLRRMGQLGPLFWALCALSLALFVAGVTAITHRPNSSRALYGVIALAQSGNLLCIAIESTLHLTLPAMFSRWNMPARLAFDLLTVAAAVHAAAFNPRRIDHARAIAALAWAAAALLIAAGISGRLPQLWWWGQVTVATLGLLAIGLLFISYHRAPHPLARVLFRFGAFSLATWLLLTVALAAADGSPGIEQQIAAVGPVIWYVFFASLLLLIPFLSKSQQVMREFSLLAAISSVATSLDLLFVAVFSLGQFTSLTLALLLSLTVYTGARQWLMGQLVGHSTLTAERLFENLYRVAREVEAEPRHLPKLLQELMRTLFEPMECRWVDRAGGHAPHVSDAGGALWVPIPQLDGSAVAPPPALLLRFARGGRRLFTDEDARLVSRILEQLLRAIAFDQAVEQGRNEERLRLAQDLHDDIGARLLTLMYQAPSPEMEDYVRYTLHDLKTLTRGLAASQHRLSHAEGEWKSDLGQRLEAAGITFGWHFSYDDDVMLNVVQWSALTRIMRELVSNAIAHAQSRRVDIHFRLQAGAVELTVADDGQGSEPSTWAPGLGLGGVRKRVKHLGGEVVWQARTPHGTCCRVHVPQLLARAG